MHFQICNYFLSTVHIDWLEKSPMWSIRAPPQRVIQIVARTINASVFATGVTDCVTARAVRGDELVPHLHDTRTRIQVFRTYM